MDCRFNLAWSPVYVRSILAPNHFQDIYMQHNVLCRPRQVVQFFAGLEHSDFTDVGRLQPPSYAPRLLTYRAFSVFPIPSPIQANTVCHGDLKTATVNAGVDRSTRSDKQHHDTDTISKVDMVGER